MERLIDHIFHEINTELWRIFQMAYLSNLIFQLTDTFISVIYFNWIVTDLTINIPVVCNLISQLFDTSLDMYFNWPLCQLIFQLTHLCNLIYISADWIANYIMFQLTDLLLLCSQRKSMISSGAQYGLRAKFQVENLQVTMHAYVESYVDQRKVQSGEVRTLM